MCHTDTSDSGKSSKRALFQVDSLIDKEGEMQKNVKKLDLLHKSLGVFVMFMLKPDKIGIKIIIKDETEDNEWCYKEAP